MVRGARGGGLVFPGSRPGAMLGDRVMTQALRNAGIGASGHGFRSSFKDWAREHGVDETLSEFALAHVEGSATVAAYARDGWNPGDEFGTYNMTIDAGDLRLPVQYDARAATQGWNDIGTFELPAGPVSLTVSDLTDGGVVVADAIRWEPVATDVRVPASENSPTGS